MGPRRCCQIYLFLPLRPGRNHAVVILRLPLRYSDKLARITPKRKDLFIIYG
jgi:hypothetical protein